MKQNMIRGLFASLSVIGFVMITVYGSWQLAVGVGVLVWAQNILMSQK